MPENILLLINENRRKSTEESQHNILKEKEIENKANYLITKAEDFDDINIRDINSFRQILEYSFVMEKACTQLAISLEQKDDISPMDVASCTNALFYLSADFMQKYFELMGYWTAKMEDRAKKRSSGKGQKEAKEKRISQVTEAIIKKYVENHHTDTLYIDKAIFHKILCDTFIGAEGYPRHHQTITDYKEAVERNLGKKIVLQKGSFLNQKDSKM